MIEAGAEWTRGCSGSRIDIVLLPRPLFSLTTLTGTLFLLLIYYYTFFIEVVKSGPCRYEGFNFFRCPRLHPLPPTLFRGEKKTRDSHWLAIDRRLLKSIIL